MESTKAAQLCIRLRLILLAKSSNHIVEPQKVDEVDRGKPDSQVNTNDQAPTDPAVLTPDNPQMPAHRPT